MFANICTNINQSLLPLVTLASFETLAVLLRAAGIATVCPIALSSEFILGIKTIRTRNSLNSCNISTDNVESESDSSSDKSPKSMIYLKLIFAKLTVSIIALLTFLLPMVILIPYFKGLLLTFNIDISNNLIDLKPRDYRTVGFSLEHYIESVSGPNLNMNLPDYSRTLGILMDEHTMTVLVDTTYSDVTGTTADTMWLYDMSDHNPQLSKYLRANECLASKLPFNSGRRSWSRSTCTGTPEIRISLDCHGNYLQLSPRLNSLIDCEKSGFGNLWDITEPGMEFYRMDGSASALSDFEPYETLTPQIETDKKAYLAFTDDQIRQLQSYFFLKGLSRVYVTIDMIFDDPVQYTFTNANQLAGFLSNRLYGATTIICSISTYAPGKEDNTIIGRSVLISTPSVGYNSPDEIHAYVNEHIYDISIEKSSNETSSKKFSKRSLSEVNPEDNEYEFASEIENVTNFEQKLNMPAIGIMVYYIIVVTLACYLGRNTVIGLIYNYITTGRTGCNENQCVSYLPFWASPKQTLNDSRYEAVHPTDESLKSKSVISELQSV